MSAPPRIPRAGAAPGVPARGVSLIELMAALAIAAVLAAIALPAYREQVARGRRSAMQAGLLEDAQSMQRYYAGHDTFEGADDAVLAVTRLPRDGTAPAYRIALASPPPTATGWSLVATPLGPMTGDRCGRFTLDQSGRQGVENAGGLPAGD